MKNHLNTNELDTAHDIFISYSSADKDTADTVCTVLEENGISCWMAPRNITPGVPFSESIIDGIKSSKVFILIFSQSSNNSVQVVREVDRAVHNGLSVINFRLVDEPLSKQLEYYLSSVHWMDAFPSPLDQHILRLCDVIKMFLKPEKVKDAELAEALSKGIIKQNEPAGTVKGSHITKRRKRLVSGILMAIIVTIVSLVVFNVGGIREARAGSIDSIILLPFGNYTGVDTLDSYIEGMHSLLISKIGEVTGLRVVGKITSDLYKDSGKSIQQITREQKVDAAIELDVMCMGDTICFQPRLMSGGDEEKQLWTGNYSEAKGNMFNLYNQIIKQIAGELSVSLTPSEDASLSETRTFDPDAVDAYMKGRYYLDQMSPASMSAAIASFEKAIEIEPSWAAPYAGLAEVGGVLNQAGIQTADNMRLIYENLDKALELDPNSVEAHYTRAIISAWTEFNWSKAEEEFLKALELNPSHVRSHSFYAHLLSILRRTDEAITQGKISQDLDSYNPLTLSLYSVVLLNEDRCEEAISCIEKALAISPGYPFAEGQYWTAYLCLGEYDKLFEIWKGWNLPLWEEYGVAELFEKVYREQGWVAVYEEAIRVNEEVWAKDGHMIPAEQAEKCFIVGNYTKALDYYEIVYENNNHDPNLPYISVHKFYDKMKGYPRYLELLKKMNLPISQSD